MDITSVILSLVITAAAYTVFPIIKLLINGGRFHKSRAHKIALWNSIVLGALFCIATIEKFGNGVLWSCGPAVLYYGINKMILTDKNAVGTEDAAKNDFGNLKKIVVVILKIIGSLFLGVITADLILAVIFGDSIEGVTAILLVCVFGIVCGGLYFWLFSRLGENKAEEPRFIYKYKKPTLPQDDKSVYLRSPQVSNCDETPKEHGKYKVLSDGIALYESSVLPEILFCRKCGGKLLEGSQFCHKCGTPIIVEPMKKESKIKPRQFTPIDELVLLTIGLPATVSDNSEKEMHIVKNQYAYCDAIIFVEFFIRANVLELAPSKECAMKFSDSYITAVIKETLNTLPDIENFFADMFYSRATLYDNIFLNSKEPAKDIVEILSHIIHKEIDTDAYVMVNDKNYRYFGGIVENLEIKKELVSLFQGIYDITKDTLEELKNYMKTL